MGEKVNAADMRLVDEAARRLRQANVRVIVAHRVQKAAKEEYMRSERALTLARNGQHAAQRKYNTMVEKVADGSYHAMLRKRAAARRAATLKEKARARVRGIRLRGTPQEE